MSFGVKEDRYAEEERRLAAGGCRLRLDAEPRRTGGRGKARGTDAG